MLNQIINWTPEILAALITGGIFSLLLARKFERNDEKRKLYADAYKTILAWQEMVHRVRRRYSGADKERKVDEKRKLVDMFHALQEELNYYQGIISVESVHLGRSYSKLVKSIKDRNATEIDRAWKNPGVELPKDLLETLGDGKDAEEFLKDTRNWLKWWQLPKIWVAWRNKK